MTLLRLRALAISTPTIVAVTLPLRKPRVGCHPCMTRITFRALALAFGLCLVLANNKALALGADHPAGQPITGSTNWPAGLERLVNVTNRIHGYFLNQADSDVYAGSQAQFADFLKDFSRLESASPRRLIVHTGVGEAKSPWSKEGRPCDWQLYTCPKGWHNLGKLSLDPKSTPEERRKAVQEPGYVVELHFWKGGTIALDQIQIPPGVVVVHER